MYLYRHRHDIGNRLHDCDNDNDDRCQTGIEHILRVWRISAAAAAAHSHNAWEEHVRRHLTASEPATSSNVVI